MLASIGYLLSTIGYAFLFLLLLTVRKRGVAKHLLLLAVAATGFWSFASLVFTPLPVQQLLMLENTKNLFWLLFLAACLKDNFSTLGDLLLRKQTGIIILLPLIALGFAASFHHYPAWQYLLQTMIALEVLLLLELIYRQATEIRWALKPLVLYLAIISVFEFVTYANALMIEQIPAVYIAAKGYIYVSVLPFLILAIRRVKHWGVDIYVSREVVMHSTLLMVAGCYLFVMALIGYWVRYWGGQWGNTIQLVFFILSLGLLVTLFLSLGFRTKIRVFITKHFFANQFDYRHEWLKLTHCLDNRNPADSPYLTGLQGFIQALNYASGSLIQVRAGKFDTLAQISSSSMSEDENTVLLAFCAFFKGKNWIVAVDELRTRPYMYEGLKVNHGLLNSVSFQLVVPIYRDEVFWGLVTMYGEENTCKKLNWELRDYLSAVNAQVSTFLFHQQGAQELAENAQFSAFNRMSSFVVHDLKNVLAQIDLILCNAKLHKTNPEFIEDTFETLEHTKARMDKMLYQLTEKHAQHEGDKGRVKVSACINQVVEQHCASSLPVPKVKIHSEKETVLDKDKFSHVLFHLISNAQQATPDDGRIELSLEYAPGEKVLLLKIADNGCGMSEAFIQQRLFKPFDTTKGNAGMGIGVFDAKAFLEKIGGHLLVQSTEQVGTTFTLVIPIY
jgi:putative PEP-CTERM system histidine kinase